MKNLNSVELDSMMQHSNREVIFMMEEFKPGASLIQAQRATN